MGMYEVCAKCGHVGRNYFVDKVFAVMASNGKEAAAKVRNYPRVKHDHKDVIRYVQIIDPFRYADIVAANKADPYFSCHNIQEQRRLCKLDIQYDTEVRHYEAKCTEQRKERQKERTKRVSSSVLMNDYYKEVYGIC